MSSPNLDLKPIRASSIAAQTPATTPNARTSEPASRRSSPLLLVERHEPRDRLVEAKQGHRCRQRRHGQAEGECPELRPRQRPDDEDLRRQVEYQPDELAEDEHRRAAEVAGLLVKRPLLARSYSIFRLHQGRRAGWAWLVVSKSSGRPRVDPRRTPPPGSRVVSGCGPDGRARGPRRRFARRRARDPGPGGPD